MSPLSDLQIDEVILSVTAVSWRKVALVIVKVADTMGSELPDGDAGYNLVAKRIEILVEVAACWRKAISKKWRHSEVEKAKLKSRKNRFRLEQTAIGVAVLRQRLRHRVRLRQRD